MTGQVITGPWPGSGTGSPPTPEYLAERRRLGMASAVYDDGEPRPADPPGAPSSWPARTVTAPVVASRVRKARRASTCPVCRAPIRPGQLIAMLGRWQHVEHVIEQQRHGRPA